MITIEMEDVDAALLQIGWGCTSISECEKLWDKNNAPYSNISHMRIYDIIKMARGNYAIEDVNFRPASWDTFTIGDTEYIIRNGRLCLQDQWVETAKLIPILEKAMLRKKYSDRLHFRDSLDSEISIGWFPIEVHETGNPLNIGETTYSFKEIDLLRRRI